MANLPESVPVPALRSDRGLKHRNHEHDAEFCRPCGACAPAPVPFALDAVYGAGCEECWNSGCDATDRIEDRWLIGARTLFLSRTARADSGCLLWTAGGMGTGYGCYWFDGRDMGAHRVAYLLFVGAIPLGLLVCHTCDVRLCVEPSHLFLGTAADNTADMIHKGREHHPRGEAAARKLTAEIVREMRASPLGCRRAARYFDVSRSTISRVRSGKLWGSV